MSLRKAFNCALLALSTSLADEQEFTPEAMVVQQQGNCDDTTKMQTWKLDDLTPEQIAGFHDTSHLQDPKEINDTEEISKASTFNESGKIERDFSYAKGSLLERARLLSQQLPGAQDAISDEVLAYEVAHRDLLFHTIDDGRYSRRIYKRNDLEVAEQKLIDEFKVFCSDRDQELLTWAFDEHHYTLRYLSSFQYDFEKSYGMLIQMQDWLRDDLPARLSVEKWSKWVNKGIFYGYGRDKQMRPILHVSMQKVSEYGLDFDDIIGLSDFVHSYLSFNAMVPGTIEQWVVIWDCKGLSWSNVPVSSIGAMVTHGTFAWKQRNGQAFFVNMHWMARAIFSLFQSFLDQFQIESNIVLGSDFKEEFDRIIGLENLQQKFGGPKPDLQDGEYFPFNFN